MSFRKFSATLWRLSVEVLTVRHTLVRGGHLHALDRRCAQHQHEERLVWRARQRHVYQGRGGWEWVGRARGGSAVRR